MRLFLISICLSIAFAMPREDHERVKRDFNTTPNPITPTENSPTNFTIIQDVTYSGSNISEPKISDNFAFNLSNPNITIVQRRGYNYTKSGAYRLPAYAATWNDAREICIDDGGHLAIIDSDEEELDLLQIFGEQKWRVKYADKNDRFLIGVHDLFGRNNNWITLFDDSFPNRHTYRKYDSDSFFISAGIFKLPALGNCLSICIDGTFIPVQCNTKYPFICELPK